MFKKIYNDIKKFKSYIYYQTKAEIKSEIVGSYLGVFWLIFEPLAFMLIYAFIGKVVFNYERENFAVFIFSGLMLWEFFSTVLKKSTKLLGLYKDIISKIYVPKYIFLIIAILISLFKLAITFLLLVLFMIIYQIPISINILWIIPIIINLVLLTFGISTFFMHFGVIITDLVNVTNILLKFLFYLTGIFYSVLDTIPMPYANIIYLGNPLSFLIIEFRNCFMYSTSINIIPFMVWFFIGILLSLLGIRLITKYENTYVKVMR